MTEYAENTPTSINDLFSCDLSGIEITKPLIPDMTIVDVEIVDLKHVRNEKNNDSIAISLRLVYPAQNNRGGTFPSGHKLYSEKVPSESIWLNESEKRDRSMILADLKRLRLWAGFQNGPFGELSQYIGSKGKCKVRIEKDKNGQYPDKNRFQFILPPGVE